MTKRSRSNEKNVATTARSRASGASSQPPSDADSLSAQIKERVMQAGLVLLLLFMATVIYLDISRLFPR